MGAWARRSGEWGFDPQMTQISQIGDRRLGVKLALRLGAGIRSANCANFTNSGLEEIGGGQAWVDRGGGGKGLSTDYTDDTDYTDNFHDQ